MATITTSTIKPTDIQERDGYTVKEFGALYGKGKDWVYKLIYSGKLKKISNLGGILIPASERHRILGKASYMFASESAATPNPKKRKAKA